MGKRSWTHEEVINRIRDLNEAGHDLSSGSVTALSPKLFAAANRYFGSWRQAVEAVGIDYSSVLVSARQRASESRTKWSKELILDRIRELAAKKESLEAAVVSSKYRSLYSAACSPRYFSGWANALQAADVPVERCEPGQRTKLVASLRDWRKQLLLDRICQLAESTDSVDGRAIRARAPQLYEAATRRYGSWAKVVDAINVAEDADEMAE